MERYDCLMSICFIICSAVPITCSAFFIRWGTPLIICAIYDVISCASVVICSKDGFHNRFLSSTFPRKQTKMTASGCEELGSDTRALHCG